MALRMMIMAQRGRLPGQGSEMMTLGQMDKAKQVEVQRRQVDEVFRTLADGQELEMCCPGGSEQPSV
jgi:SWI/SNF-related matrix-associated actin-dependent regulator of chromatin subfamily A3